MKLVGGHVIRKEENASSVVSQAIAVETSIIQHGTETVL